MKPKKIKIVGAGLAGCVCANILADELNCEIDIYEKEEKIGGLCRDDAKGIDGLGDIYQLYGPHIFHTSMPNVIKFVLDFAEFRPFTNRPIAVTGKGYARLPLSIETIKDLNNEDLEKEETKLDKQLIFDNIIKDYSQKQWGKKPGKKVIDRLKIYDGLSGSYFNDLFEGIPKDGFSKMMEKMTAKDNIKVIYKETTSDKEDYDFIVWTGPIDEIKGFNKKIEWKGTEFVYSKVDCFSHRLSPVYNLCADYFAATRSTNMPMLTQCKSEREELIEIPGSKAKHYPIVKNRKAVDRWIEKQKEKGFYCCGRLGTASYLDMDDTIKNAFDVCGQIISRL